MTQHFKTHENLAKTYETWWHYYVSPKTVCSLIADSWDTPSSCAHRVYIVKSANGCLVPLTVPWSVAVCSGYPPNHVTYFWVQLPAMWLQRCHRLPNNTHNEFWEQDREGLFNEREGGWGERAEREIGHSPADGMRQKVQKITEDRRDREVNKGSSKNTRRRPLVKQMEVSVHKWTDGECLCVKWQMSKTCLNVPYIQTACSFRPRCSLFRINTLVKIYCFNAVFSQDRRVTKEYKLFYHSGILSSLYAAFPPRPGVVHYGTCRQGCRGNNLFLCRRCWLNDVRLKSPGNTWWSSQCEFNMSWAQLH